MHDNQLERLFLRFVADGDEVALEQLMRRAGPPLRRLARRHGARGDDADELVQETLVAAIQRADRYDPTRPLLPWLKGILALKAARLARDELRRRRLLASVQDLEREGAPASVEAAGRELDGDLQSALAELPARYREPLREHLFAGRSAVEIAARLGMQRATVRVWLHRGLRALRAQLARWALLLLAILWPRRVAAAALLGLIAVAGAVVWWRDEAAGPVPLASVAPGHLGVDAEAAAAAAREGARRDVVVRPAAAGLRVLDADRQPLPHVGVTFMPPPGRDAVLLRRYAVSDAQGAVMVPEPVRGDWSAVSDRGVGLKLSSASRELVVGGGVTVSGVVRDALGVAVADAAVWLSADSDGPWRGQDVARSGSDGRFVLRHVPLGAFLAARHTTLARGDVVRVAAGGDVELRLAEASGRVHCRASDERGAPLADAVVWVGEAMDAAPLWLAQGAAPWRAPPSELRTDVLGGAVACALEPGWHPVFVRADGFAPQVQMVQMTSGDALVELRLQRGAAVVGRVHSTGGRLAAEVVLRSAQPHASGDLTADPDGGFRFDCVPPGRVQVAARAAGFVPTVVDVDVSAGMTASVDLDLQPAPRIDGQIWDALGAPVGGCAVRAVGGPASALAVPEVARTGADGVFSLPLAEPGPPNLELRLPGEPLWRRVERGLQWSGSAVRIELPREFVARGFLHGTLRDHLGVPLSAARLFVRRDGVQWAEIGRSDAAGQFRLGPLPPGRYLLFAETTRPECPTVALDEVTLREGEERVCDFTAPAHGTLELTLRRDDGEAVGDLVVTLVAADSPRRQVALTTTQRSPAPLRQALLPGDYLLFAMGSRFVWLEGEPLRIAAGATSRLELVRPAASKRTLWLRDLPATSRAAPWLAHLRSRPGGAPVGVFTLAPHAPDRLSAVLPAGDFELEVRDESATVWRGLFSLPSTVPSYAPVEIGVAPR